ncbi:MAG: hypothetical protein QM731_11065 [Chitinophagaceae bacterium]
MKKAMFIFLLALVSITGWSQEFAQDVAGRPYQVNQYMDIEGSPFFIDGWSKGIIYMKDGSKAEIFQLQLDLYLGQLLFKHNEQALIVENPVKEFVLQPATGVQYLFRNGYQSIDKNNAATWYQVLQDGPVSLVKQVKKVLQEKNEYNAATKSKSFSIVETLYIVKADGSLVKVKKDKSSLLDALADKKELLNRFIEKEKLRVKNEDDMKAIVKAYNENAG